MTPAQVSAVLATVGAAFLAQSIACALLFRRVRALSPRTGSASTPSAELAEQIRSIEARLTRLEAEGGQGRKSATPPGESKKRRLDRRQVASSDGPVLIAVPSLASTPRASSTTEAAAEFDRRFGAIWGLADSGTPFDEIARATGYPVGQVELILGLRPSKNAEASGSRPRGGTDV